MGIHTNLPIYKVAYDLFNTVTDLVKNMPRDFKSSLGGKISGECLEILVLIFRSNCAREKESYLRDRLHARINPSKTILQPVDRGVDFVGQVVRPWHRETRKRTVKAAMSRMRDIDASELFETANSYYGLFRQATHSFHHRTKLSNILRYRGHCISGNLTKTYRRAI